MQEAGKQMKRLKQILILTAVLLSGNSFSQCDFVNDITGIALATPPSGAAADPLQFTQIYVLVDEDGNIVATNSTPDFTGLAVGLYNIYAVNYDINEAGSVTPLLDAGDPWTGIESYSGCLDYTGNYGGCLQSVCDEISVLEDQILVNPAGGYNASPTNVQEYCLVCGGTVQAVNSTGTFDLSLYPAASAGADCEVVAMNYLLADGAPVIVGDNWGAATASKCGDCWDYVGRNLVITSPLPTEFISFDGEADGPWNRLNWATAAEINCDHFIVERSSDAVTFEDIGKVDGHGNSEVMREYEFFDRKPENNIEYYRLRQVDFSGDYKHTSIIAVRRADILDIAVYPNPASFTVNVDLSTGGHSAGVISVLDANGKEAFRQEFDCENYSGCSISIPVEQYDAGIYCIMIQDDRQNHVYQKRFVKK